MICRICNSSCKPEPILIKEKMFNNGETFEYLECLNCRCIQIRNFPKNLNNYYPLQYYSFNPLGKRSFKRRAKLLYYRVLSNLKNDFYHHPDFLKYGLKYSDRGKKILDVGSGNGKLLYQLRDYGFFNLTGIDPYIQKETRKPGFSILKKNIEDLEEKYDIIMSHHSLEHMPDPKLFFRHIPRLLDDKGLLILRIPVYPNYIWDEYGLDWIQLDAPRHLYTFTLETIKYLCESYQLVIEKIEYDNHPWSLAATEYCRNGKSLEEFRFNVHISTEQNKKHIQSLLNQNGDAAMFLIRRNV